MGYRIRVPLNSPACESYLRDGWVKTHIDGQWATLQMEPLEVHRSEDEHVQQELNPELSPPRDH